MRLFKLLLSLFFIILCLSCNTAKLSVADQQFNNGDYFKAVNQYKNIYAKILISFALLLV